MKINWRIIGASALSLLAFVAALPYQLGDVATIIPPEWKAKVAVASACAAFILRTLNTNMASVLNPPTQTNVTNVITPTQTPTSPTKQV